MDWQLVMLFIYTIDISDKNNAVNTQIESIQSLVFTALFTTFLQVYQTLRTRVQLDDEGNQSPAENQATFLHSIWSYAFRNNWYFCLQQYHTIALWILKKTDAGFGITQELTRALLSMVSLTISVEVWYKLNIIWQQSGMNVGFAYYRYLYAPSAFAKHILSQALYGISVPALLLSLSGLLLTVKDGVPLNWNFMILLFANLLFTIVDRSISALGLAPHWFVRYRVTTCFLSYLVIVNVALVYMRKLRGWDRKKMLMNDVKEETENEDLSEIAEEVYKNTGLRTDIKTKVPTNQKQHQQIQCIFIILFRHCKQYVDKYSNSNCVIQSRIHSNVLTSFFLNYSMDKSKERQVYNSILEVIGNTPLIRLNKIPKEEGVECEILAKCEFLNPTGSHKDRIALNLIETAEKEGHLKPGGTIIEATSGNTGLALSFVAAVKGYKAVMVAVPKTSQEKVDLMKGFGADVVKSKVNSSKDPEGIFAMAERLKESTPGAFYTSQFSNKANPETHYKNTSEEIYSQCGGKLDFLFMAAGTGGTISGNGKKLKEKVPTLKVIGCDPVGSVIGTPGGNYIPFKVEGVGYDFVPPNCNLKVVDEWIKFNDRDAFMMTRRLMMEEGLMCGGSAGGILWCAIDFAKKAKLGKEHTIVIILPDTCRNYLTKQVNKEWLLEYGFIDEESYRHMALEDSLLPEKRFGDSLQLKDLDTKALKVLKLDDSIGTVWDLLEKEKLAIVNKTGLARDGDFKGILTAKAILTAISSGKFSFEDTIDKVMKTDYSVLSENLRVSTVGRMLELKEYILYRRSDTKQVYMVTEAEIMRKLKEGVKEDMEKTAEQVQKVSIGDYACQSVNR
eukprot:TRINITY_DN803_c0_g1_i1.p1 TRINITY_DN803_c0_g1~~TRINITY_DN803_c0_g1_i1.p1  ORF type:complete len:844 (+),score=58.10 TRINITY_DN803_c0_g1_i1:1520-4051(+)